MGMFDYLTCKYPLPAAGANDLQFQTKDTPAMWMDSYEIDADGLLWHELYDVEDHSDPTATGLTAILGLMTRVNPRKVLENWSGAINFYAGGGGWWIEFQVHLVEGKVTHLHVVEAQGTIPQD